MSEIDHLVLLHKHHIGHPSASAALICAGVPKQSFAQSRAQQYVSAPAAPGRQRIYQQLRFVEPVRIRDWKGNSSMFACTTISTYARQPTSRPAYNSRQNKGDCSQRGSDHCIITVHREICSPADLKYCFRPLDLGKNFELAKLGRLLHLTHLCTCRDCSPLLRTDSISE